MYVANLTPNAIGLVLLLGSMAVSAGITLVVVTALDRHNERVLVEEYTASLEAFLDEMEARLTDDNPCVHITQEEIDLGRAEQDAAWSAWCAENDVDPDWIEDDSAWDMPSERELERNLEHDLRICGDMVDELADYLFLLRSHPDAVGRECMPTLDGMLDGLIDQEYNLVQITR